jgi:MFS family permease
MVIVDTTVVNVALPQLSRGMHATTSELQWVVDAYSLTFAALLLTGGMTSDTRGAKRVFIAGMALFCACSLACGVAPDIGVLIAARAAQGIGGGGGPVLGGLLVSALGRRGGGALPAAAARLHAGACELGLLPPRWWCL